MKYTTTHLYTNYCVCANHFEDNQFMNPLKKNKLIHTAAPTLVNITNPPPKLAPIGSLSKQYCDENIPSTSEAKIETQPAPVPDSEPRAHEPTAVYCKSLYGMYLHYTYINYLIPNLFLFF